METVYVTDRHGNIVVVCQGKSEGEAQQKAVIERRAEVKRSGNSWGYYRFAKLIPMKE